MDISKKLKDRRKELHLTMLEVAQKVGVSEATVSRWESGDIANMRRDKIALLAKALQVSPAYIMGWDDEKKDASSIASIEMEGYGLMKAYKTEHTENDVPEENVVVYHRDGKTSKIKLSKEKMDIIVKMIDAVKDDDNPNL